LKSFFDPSSILFYIIYCNWKSLSSSGFWICGTFLWKFDFKPISKKQ